MLRKRTILDIDLQLTRCCERIRKCRATKNHTSLMIELAVADRLLDERNAMKGA